jgi:hypothetical protein
MRSALRKATGEKTGSVVEGSCEHGNEPSGSINAGKFLSGCTFDSFSKRAQHRK